MPRRKTRRSWGSIRSISRNKHVIRWVENTTQGRVRKCHTFEGSAAEASLWLERKHIECADKGDKPVPTIGDVCRMWWLPSLHRRLDEGKVKQRTVATYERAWKISEERWGRVPATSIHPKDVQDWILTLTEGDAKSVLKVLKAIQDYAVKYEICDSNKFRIKYELPPKSHTRDKGVLTLEQAEEFMATLRGNPVEGAYIVACFGGARTGEALAVRADEITYAEHEGVRMALVPIVRTVSEAPGEVENSTKTPSGMRTTIVPEPYCDRLLDIASRGGWLCDRGDGMPMSKKQMQKMWRGELHGPVPFANLRPSWRTFAEMRWKIPFNTLEIIMGHKIEGITGQHYFRPSVDDIARSFAEAYATSVKLGK